VLTATRLTVLGNSSWTQYTYLSFASSSSIPYLDPVIETIFPFGLILLHLSFLSLRSHQDHVLAATLKQRDLIRIIKKKNDDLRDELDKELSRTKQKTNSESSFISPIAKVIKMIRALQISSDNLDDESIANLDYIIHLLLSNHLFKPQLMNSNMESEVNQWLKQITETDDEAGMRRSTFDNRNAIAVRKTQVDKHNTAYEL
jgi:hypothetical protein